MSKVNRTKEEEEIRKVVSEIVNHSNEKCSNASPGIAWGDSYNKMETEYLDLVLRSQEIIKDYQQEIYAHKVKILNLQSLVHGAHINYLINTVLNEGRKNLQITKEVVNQAISIENERYGDILREALDTTIEDKAASEKDLESLPHAYYVSSRFMDDEAVKIPSSTFFPSNTVDTI